MPRPGQGAAPGETSHLDAENSRLRASAKEAADEVARLRAVVSRLESDAAGLTRQLDARNSLDGAAAKSGGLFTNVTLAVALSAAVADCISCSGPNLLDPADGLREVMLQRLREGPLLDVLADQAFSLRMPQAATTSHAATSPAPVLASPPPWKL